MEPVRVRFRDCACPGTPHDGKEGRDDGDVALLRPHLNFEGGAAAFAAFAQAIEDGQTSPTQLSVYLGPVYIRRGVIGWNLLDADGEAVPFSLDYLLDDLPYEQAFNLVDRADDLYTKGVTDPLERRIASSSPSGRMNGQSSTSATPRSSSGRRSRSRSSSAARVSQPT